jgi:hypothetical protein
MGGLRRALGAQLELEGEGLPAGPLVRELLQRAGEDPHNILVLINGVEWSALQGEETRLKDGDEVVLIPTVHGGLGYIAPSWDQIYELCIRLAEKVSASRVPVEGIVAISRGGLTPARVLSDLLGVKELHTLRCEYYVQEGETRERPVIVDTFNADVRGKHLLVVDDVADIGSSLLEVVSYVRRLSGREVKTAVLYVKPWSKAGVDFYVAETPHWIIFPWERMEVLAAIMAREGPAGVRATGLPDSLVRRLLKVRALGDHRSR